jgi:hypothetical protein
MKTADAATTAAPASIGMAPRSDFALVDTT